MKNHRLFEGAPESLAIAARWVPPNGWKLVLQMRRQGDAWEDSHREEYEGLSTAELVDVLCAAVPLVFGE